MPARARRLLPAAAIFVGLLAAAPNASATNSSLNWKPCGDAPNVQCATLRAPLDYDHPDGDQVKLFIARSPATGHRIGSLFYNPGGPGGTVADFFEALGADGFPGLNEHFDIIGMDPRGVGQSTPSIDCKVNQETLGIYSEPFTTPFNLDVGDLIAKDRRYINRCIDRNDGILAHVSTANVARDMDLLRKALGERKLNYFGYSYGTFLGATYASLFPNNYRAMVLDGPLDADGYINNPLHDAERADVRLRTRARPLLPGLRRPPGRLQRLRRRRSDARARHADRRRRRGADPRRRLRRRTRGRSTATTSGPRPCSRCTRRRCGR